MKAIRAALSSRALSKRGVHGLNAQPEINTEQTGRINHHTIREKSSYQSLLSTADFAKNNELNFDFQVTNTGGRLPMHNGEVT